HQDGEGLAPADGQPAPPQEQERSDPEGDKRQRAGKHEPARVSREGGSGRVRPLTQSVPDRYTASPVQHDALAREATRGSAVKLGAELIGRALGLLTTLLIARELGAADYGSFGALSVVAVVAAEAADLGLQGTASRALVARTLSLTALL